MNRVKISQIMPISDFSLVTQLIGKFSQIKIDLPETPEIRELMAHANPEVLELLYTLYTVN
jgi:hypothetical protein